MIKIVSLKKKKEANTETSATKGLKQRNNSREIKDRSQTPCSGGMARFMQLKKEKKNINSFIILEKNKTFSNKLLK